MKIKIKRVIILNIVRFFNAYKIKELILLFENCKFTTSSQKRPMLISVVDGKRSSQGLTDRFKGIISMYALSKATNTLYRIVYTHPFHLTEFLIPNTFNWLPQENELSDSVRDVRYRILRKNPRVNKMLRYFPLKKQYRVYGNYDYIEQINLKFDKNYTFNGLFNELFKPTKLLENELNYHLEKIGKKYIACTFRFQSLLGDFKEYHFKSITAEKQKQLIDTCKNALIKLIESNDCTVLVTSDSIRFLTEISALKSVYIIPGKVVHVDCTTGETNNVYMKSFVDFFMIGNAEKVFIIGTKQMYATQFPVYAAALFNKPFERIRC